MDSHNFSLFRSSADPTVALLHVAKQCRARSAARAVRPQRTLSVAVPLGTGRYISRRSGRSYYQPLRLHEPRRVCGGAPHRLRTESYSAVVDFQPVREAYSSMSELYIGLFDGDWQAHEDDTALIQRHLTGLQGPVLDLGCGPGHWSAYLHSLDVDVTGIDMVPEFIAHARATHLGPEFRLGSNDGVGCPGAFPGGNPDLVLDDPPAACGPRPRARRIPPAPRLLPAC
jgi:hypothetical protein